MAEGGICEALLGGPTIRRTARMPTTRSCRNSGKTTHRRPRGAHRLETIAWGKYRRPSPGGQPGEHLRSTGENTCSSDARPLSRGSGQRGALTRGRSRATLAPGSYLFSDGGDTDALVAGGGSRGDAAGARLGDGRATAGARSER